MLLQIILKGVAPVQVDGEPWLESPCEFDVTAVDQAIVLANEPINDS